MRADCLIENFHFQLSTLYYSLISKELCYSARCVVNRPLFLLLLLLLLCILYVFDDAFPVMTSNNLVHACFYVPTFLSICIQVHMHTLEKREKIVNKFVIFWHLITWWILTVLYWRKAVTSDTPPTTTTMQCKPSIARVWRGWAGAIH